jgi:hypothetical protein
MPFLASDLDACPAPLLVMARNGDHRKPPLSEGPSSSGQQLPSHRARMDAGPDWALSSTRWGFRPRR